MEPTKTTYSFHQPNEELEIETFEFNGELDQNFIGSPKVQLALGELYLSSPTNLKKFQEKKILFPITTKKSKISKKKASKTKKKKRSNNLSLNLPDSPSGLFEETNLLDNEEEEDKNQSELPNEIELEILVKESQEKAFSFLKAAADQGDIKASFLVGSMYHMGEGVKQNFERAFEYFRHAADNGSADAQFSLGIMYQNGQFVEKSIEKAIIFYKLGAEDGKSPYSCVNLGNIYQDGLIEDKIDEFGSIVRRVHIPRDFKKSFKYFSRAADKGEPNALFNCALMLQSGTGVEKSIEKAIDCFKKSANQGNVYAQVNLGLLYLKGGEIEKNVKNAIKYFKMAAFQHSHSKALFNLGFIYERQAIEKETEKKSLKKSKKSKKTGKSKQIFQEIESEIMKDNRKESKRMKLSQKSFKYYKKSAFVSDNTNVEAVLALGACYLRGNGIEQSLEKAFEWFKIAADKGNDINAQAAVGVCYKDAIGVQRDVSLAEKYLSMAADRGDSKSQINLAMLYKEDMKDLPRSFHYFSLASAKGEAIAQHNLSEIYMLGEGVAKNEENAYFYTKLLADKGSVNSQFQAALLGQKFDKESARYYFAKVCTAARKGDQSAISILKTNLHEVRLENSGNIMPGGELNSFSSYCVGEKQRQNSLSRNGDPIL